MHTFTLNRLPLLLTALLSLLFLTSARSEEFLARMEADASGRWLVFPTVPGMHYVIESAHTLGPGAIFTPVTGGYHYGNGTERRYYLGPPPPPPAAPTAPDPRPIRPIHFQLVVRHNPDSSGYSTIYLHRTQGHDAPEQAWSIQFEHNFPPIVAGTYIDFWGDHQYRHLLSVSIRRYYDANPPAQTGAPMNGICSTPAGRA
jgi:hypothetical protein